MVAEWRRIFSKASTALEASWQRAPLVFLRGEPHLVGRISVSEVAALVDAGSLPAGQASLKGASWASEPLKAPLAEVITRATVYANNAGLHIPCLAELGLAAVDVLGWPIACNAYLTAPGLPVSVPPHTDRQDVLVLQACGTKYWEVYAPPAVGDADPLRRGKDGDEIRAEELGEPLLRTVLAPGDALYVPLGFPHATSTAGGGGSASSSSAAGPPADVSAGDASVHITVNVDSLIWGLSYRMLWTAAVRHARLSAGQADPAEEAGGTAGMTWAQYSALQAPLPMGFLMPPELEKEAPCEELRRRAARWEGAAGASAGNAAPAVRDEDIVAAWEMLRRHREALMRLHRQMYLDALLGLSDLPPLEREMGHWQLLQEQMRVLRSELGWEG